MEQDIIRVKDRILNVLLLSGSRWPAKSSQGTLQPISISVDIFYDIAPASVTDDLERSINYSSVSKKLGSAFTESTPYKSIEEVASRGLNVVQEELVHTLADKIKIKAVQLKAPLHCKDVGVEVWSSRESRVWKTTRVQHFVTEFTRPIIIGVNDVEREEEQDVVVNISVDTRDVSQDCATLDFRELTRSLWMRMGSSSYLTLEALTTLVAQETLASLSANFAPGAKPSVTVAVAKPCALVYASASEIQITRVRYDTQVTEPGELHRAVIALGSNLGDRFYNIEYALRLLESPSIYLGEENLGHSPEVAVVDTSFLYETSPMYVTDQPAFINGACLIETNLGPGALLQLLKAIESAVGRVPTIRNGPRVVDLDIIFYNNLVIDTRSLSEGPNLDNLEGELVIPHPRLHEREFVLRPLNDMIPEYIHPKLGKSVRSLLRAIPRASDEPPMRKVLPFPNLPRIASNSTAEPPATLTYWTHPVSPPFPPIHSSQKLEAKTKTHLMATLNYTPDSFSDGSEYNTLPNALSYVENSVLSGASIIDIGGYSTRPGAAFVSVDEEIERVVPVIPAIRSKGCEIPISVDTFRWEVAEAALKAGANCINDVYAFTGNKAFPGTWHEDEDVLRNMRKLKEVAREHATPVVLMHSRGDAGRNKDYSAYDYAKASGTSAVIEGVRIELGDKVDMIVKGRGGVRRWLVVVDPGIGFSKTLEGNLELLRNGAKVVEDVEAGTGDKRRRNPLSGFPTLVGCSRKSYLGEILSKGDRGRTTTAKERVWATAAAVTCAVRQGAMIVRVHDVKEMADVVAVSNELWS